MCSLIEWHLNIGFAFGQSNKSCHLTCGKSQNPDDKKPGFQVRVTSRCYSGPREKGKRDKIENPLKISKLNTIVFCGKSSGKVTPT